MRTGMKKQKGSVAVMSALFMVMLIGFAALAIDIGNLMVARNELQNAADGAAMAGAACLYDRTECNNTAAAQPDWTDAAASAVSFATVPTTTTPPNPTNLVQGKVVKVISTATGYWNITGTPSGLESPSTPGFTPGVNDMPALQVTVTKDPGNANGGVVMYLAEVLGVTVMKANATATAVVSRPSYVGPDGLFPFALGQCLYDSFWNSKTNSPSTYQAGDTEPAGQPALSQTVGQPWIFAVGSTYHVGSCLSGQWTSFNTNAQSTNVISNMFPPPSGSGNAVGVGISASGEIFLKSGDVSALYHQVKSCASGTGDGSCAWVTVPVVPDASITGSLVPVNAFACIHILGEVGSGKNSYITLQMSADQSKCSTPNSSGSGPNYGAITPPRLVQ